jgi:protein-disulfide isomerase
MTHRRIHPRVVPACFILLLVFQVGGAVQDAGSDLIGLEDGSPNHEAPHPESSKFVQLDVHEPRTESEPRPQALRQGWVRVRAANLREGPGTHHAIVKLLPLNTEVHILGSQGDWLEVEPAIDSAVAGWLFANLLADKPWNRAELTAVTQPKTSQSAVPRHTEQSTDWPYIPLLLVVALYGFAKFKNWLEISNTRARIEEICQAIGTRIHGCFQLEPCSRCYESQVRLVQVPPSARSVQLQCTTCERKYWAPAHSANAGLLLEECAKLQQLTTRLSTLCDGIACADLTITIAPGPLPFERTTREPIPEAVRSEVWRRDGGRCTKCGSNAQLEFDHIIPVSKGGAKIELRLAAPLPERPAITPTGPSRGADDAPVTLIVFSDFLCPYCRQLTGILEEVVGEFGDNVRIVYKYLPLPTHTRSIPAARAAFCAGEQGRFWDFHDRLYTSPGEPSPKALWDHARALGLDLSESETCTSSERSDARVKADMKEARMAGISGTPTLLINGKVFRGKKTPEVPCKRVDGTIRMGYAVGYYNGRLCDPDCDPSCYYY